MFSFLILLNYCSRWVHVFTNILTSTIFYVYFWKNWFFTVFCFSSPFPVCSMLDLTFRACCWAGNITWTNHSNIELEGGGEGLFLTVRRREGDILKVWKIVYFHINQGHDKNVSCVANRSSLIKVQTKYLTLYVHTIWGFSKTFLEKIVALKSFLIELFVFLFGNFVHFPWFVARNKNFLDFLYWFFAFWYFIFKFVINFLESHV